MKVDERTDQELVARFLSDRGAPAFEALYDRHTPYLFRVALRMLNGSQESAEDCLQEVWIRAVTSLDRFRGESALRTWLCGITMNCCRETWRRKAFVSMEDLPEATGATPGEGQRIDALSLDRALQKLDAQSREIIELFDVLGHTHDEVSAILGVAPGTSKSRLFRARECLRGLMGVERRETERSRA